MEFTFGNINYVLEFERQYKNVTVYKNGEPRTVRSTHPFTTAKLLELRVDKEPSKIAQAVVGCSPGDAFSYAAGRLQALKLLSHTLRKSKAPKGLTSKIWTVYLNRHVVTTKMEFTTPKEVKETTPGVNPEAGLT